MTRWALALVLGATAAQSQPLLSQPPRLLMRVEPQVRGPDEGGVVLLEIDLTVEGTVSRAVVLSGCSPAIDAAAVDAIKASRFSPAEIDGQPVPVRIRYESRFAPRQSLKLARFEGRVLARGLPRAHRWCAGANW